MRMTVVLEYSTGADNRETLTNYDTIDPEECAAIDREGVYVYGGVINFINAVFDPADVVSWEIEPVTE